MNMESRSDRERELDDILSDYVEILNKEGAESRKELAYLKKYEGDADALRVLRGARAIKALFEVFGDFPDLSSVRPTQPKPIKRNTKSKTID